MRSDPFPIYRAIPYIPGPFPIYQEGATMTETEAAGEQVAEKMGETGVSDAHVV